MATTAGSLLVKFTGRNICRLQTFGRSLNQARFKSVQAAVLKELKKPLVIDEITSPKLKKNEVRIKVQYCSVNQSDYEIIQGGHEYSPKLPFVPGYEVSGEVLEVGSNAKQAGFNVGDKVIGLNKESCGGFAQECVVVLQDCYQMPQGINSKECSALLDGYTLALLGLVRRAGIKENDTVMVTAAGGGVGLSAVDLAANVYKAKVIAVCSTEDKAALVRDKGAFSALKYSDKFVEEIKQMTKNEGVKIVFDATGGEVFHKAIQCVSNEGKIVLASNAARATPSISPIVLLPHAVSLIGVSLWHYRNNNLDAYRKSIEDIIDMAEQELITPHISKVFKLADVNEAFEYLQDRKCTGKVVLEIDD